MTIEPGGGSMSTERLRKMQRLLRPFIDHQRGCSIYLPDTNPNSDYCDCGINLAISEADAIVRDAISEVDRLTAQLRAVPLQIEVAFKAGYHCPWSKQSGYSFDPIFNPGDPDGAYAAWEDARVSPTTQPPHLSSPSR